MHLKPGEEVIIQGYTCIVVPNAIHAAGGVPVYADIDPDSLNLTIQTVQPLITTRTRAVICQHTFGIPANAKALRSLCDEHRLILIEDCAHAIDGSKDARNIGLFGDAVLLSFGRDKAISGIAGGSILTRKNEWGYVLRELERGAVSLRYRTIAALLTYAPRMVFIMRRWGTSMIGRGMLWLLKRLGLVPPVLTTEEKQGYMSPVLRSLPNACAALALFSLRRLDEANERRRTLMMFYEQHGRRNNWPMLKEATRVVALQKFPLFVHDAQKKRALLKHDSIHLDDGWTGCIICPDSVDMNCTDYLWGTDPAAERASEQILNLPTHPLMSLFDARRLARRIDELLKEERR